MQAPCTTTHATSAGSKYRGVPGEARTFGLPLGFLRTHTFRTLKSTTVGQYVTRQKYTLRTVDLLVLTSLGRRILFLHSCTRSCRTCAHAVRSVNNDVPFSWRHRLTGGSLLSAFKSDRGTGEVHTQTHDPTHPLSTQTVHTHTTAEGTNRFEVDPDLSFLCTLVNTKDLGRVLVQPFMHTLVRNMRTHTQYARSTTAYPLCGDTD